jgi:radical SAM-linked protein
VTDPSPSETPLGQGESPDPLRIRYRIRFAKTGLLRWISHRDLARLWERLLRRAGLKLSMTEGFHPKPRVSFPSALALGVESQDEVVEIELAEQLRPAELLQRLASDHQPGLTIHRVSQLPPQLGKAQLLRSDYVITAVDGADRQSVERAIERLLSQQQVSIERKNKTLKIDVASQILALAFREQCLELSLAASDTASLRPADVLQLLGLADWIENGSLITRVRVVLQRELESDDPALVAVASPGPGHWQPTSPNPPDEREESDR